MFDGFDKRELETERGTIHARVGGSGPPLLLLHGYPETHLMWRGGAALAERFTVVATDLSGYGDSLRPAPAADHAPHSKRAIALDQIQAMESLGFERFAVAGHDRGGRVAYRMVLDHPERVSALAVLDIVPTAEVWARADDRLALGYWHWGFLAQPAPLPERLIAGDPDALLRLPPALDRARPRARPVPRVGDRGVPRPAPDASAVEAICEDYRAGASIDRQLDEADRGRLIDCPVLVLWGTRARSGCSTATSSTCGALWARDVRGRGVDATHFLVEDCPEEVARELTAFFGGVPVSGGPGQPGDPERPRDPGRP